MKFKEMFTKRQLQNGVGQRIRIPGRANDQFSVEGPIEIKPAPSWYLRLYSLALKLKFPIILFFSGAILYLSFHSVIVKNFKIFIKAKDFMLSCESSQQVERVFNFVCDKRLMTSEMIKRFRLGLNTIDYDFNPLSKNVLLKMLKDMFDNNVLFKVTQKIQRNGIVFKKGLVWSVEIPIKKSVVQIVVPINGPFYCYKEQDRFTSKQDNEFNAWYCALMAMKDIGKLQKVMVIGFEDPLITIPNKDLSMKRAEDFRDKYILPLNFGSNCLKNEDIMTYGNSYYFMDKNSLAALFGVENDAREDGMYIWKMLGINYKDIKNASTHKSDINTLVKEIHEGVNKNDDAMKNLYEKINIFSKDVALNKLYDFTTMITRQKRLKMYQDKYSPTRTIVIISVRAE